jgi:hypothetical protein
MQDISWFEFTQKKLNAASNLHHSIQKKLLSTYVRQANAFVANKMP